MVAAAKGDAAGALGQLDHTNLFPSGVVDIELALREVYIAGRIRHHAGAAARDKRRQPRLLSPVRVRRISEAIS